MENFDLKKFLVENKLTTNSKVIKESPELPDLLDDETIENSLTSRSGYLMNRVVVELEGDQWYIYGEVDSSTPFWEKLTYSDNLEKNREIIFEQDILEGSEKSKICKYIKSIIREQRIPVVNVYLGAV